jgi:hypothetical protein
MKNRFVLAFALLLLGAGLLYAAAVQENYTPARNPSDRTTAIANHRTAFSADDSATTTTPIDPQPTGGDPTIVVAPRFSASGATALVEVWLYQNRGSGTYVLLGVSARQTATASTTLRAGASGAYLVHSPLFFDSCGADAYDVRYRTVSSGTVEPWAWTCGASSLAAE